MTYTSITVGRIKDIKASSNTMADQAPFRTILFVDEDDNEIMFNVLIAEEAQEKVNHILDKMKGE